MELPLFFKSQMIFLFLMRQLYYNQVTILYFDFPLEASRSRMHHSIQDFFLIGEYKEINIMRVA